MHAPESNTHASARKQHACICAPQVDRLITELKLPPADAYHKLRHTIEEVNALISTHSGGNAELLVRPRAALLSPGLSRPSALPWVCVACWQ